MATVTSDRFSGAESSGLGGGLQGGSGFAPSDRTDAIAAATGNAGAGHGSHPGRHHHNPPSGIACCLRTTRVATSRGDVAVEDLVAGDLIVVLSGKHRPVRWAGRWRIDVVAHPQPDHVRPIRIRRDALAVNMPYRDVLLSPDHAVFIDGALVPPRLLVNHQTIVRDAVMPTVEYYHIELDRHDILLAEGLPTESYLDTGNRGMFDSAELPAAPHVDIKGNGQPRRVAGSCVPLVTRAEHVEPLWRRIADCALASGFAAAARPTMNEPARRIVAQHRTLPPVVGPSMVGRHGMHAFIIPPGTATVRLVSQGRPGERVPALDRGSPMPGRDGAAASAARRFGGIGHCAGRCSAGGRSSGTKNRCGAGPMVTASCLWSAALMPILPNRFY